MKSNSFAWYLLLLVTVFLAFVNADTTDLEIVAYTDGRGASQLGDDRFVSFTLDVGILHDLNLQNTHLRALTRTLAPANLRVGGTWFNNLVYLVDEQEDASLCTPERDAKHLCLNMKRWTEIVEFCTATNLRLVFDLNILLGRNASCTTFNCWDSSNIRRFLQYTAQQWPLFPNAFEIGNELEHFLDPLETARIAGEIRTMIYEFWPHNNATTRRPLLVGPAANVRPDWMRRFAAHASTVIDVITYHLYPAYGGTHNLEHTIPTPAWLDFSHQIMHTMHRAATVTTTTSIAVWIGESAAAWEGGRNGITNGFVSAFWYLDTLGQAASMGHAAFCRSSLVGNQYGLLEQKFQLYKPNPDFWVALLFRRLVIGRLGTTHRRPIMMDAMQFTPGKVDFDPDVRTYLACTPPPPPPLSPFLDDTQYYAPGAMTLIWINTAKSWKTIRLVNETGFHSSDAGHSPPPPFYGLPRWDFVLTAGPAPASSSNDSDCLDPLCSRLIRLNGQVLQLSKQNTNNNIKKGVEDDVLPPLDGVAASDERLQVPPQSMGFSVFTGAQATACLVPSTDTASS